MGDDQEATVVDLVMTVAFVAIWPLLYIVSCS